MKRMIGILCMCGVAALAGCANSTRPAMTDSGAPDPKAMGEAMMAAAKPGPMHDFLSKNIGTWDGKCKFWHDPSMPPEESTCTTTFTPMLDGRFIRSETRGSMMGFDGQPMNFEGFGIYGYNNETKQFESTWVDNCGTMQMNLTGKLSSDKRTMTWNTKYMCPMTHQMTWMREVERYTGPDSMTLEMWGPNCMTGKGEQKMMEINYTRRSGGGKW